jgi:hypothetical protein
LAGNIPGYFQRVTHLRIHRIQNLDGGESYPRSSS